MTIPLGLEGHLENTVTAALTARNVGSGLAEVLATPVLIAMAEEVCWRSVQALLPAGQSTVGAHIDFSHTAPTPVGLKVWCDCRVTGAEGRKLLFEVQAFDECGPIGQGSHERFIVDDERFQTKAEARRNPLP